MNPLNGLGVLGFFDFEDDGNCLGQRGANVSGVLHSLLVELSDNFFERQCLAGRLLDGQREERGHVKRC